MSNVLARVLFLGISFFCLPTQAHQPLFKGLSLDEYLLTQGYVIGHGLGFTNEGFMTRPQKQQFQERLKLYPTIETIMEIGLHAGHSAETFIESCPHMKLFVSFDINHHPFTQVAASYFQATYKDRFIFIPGRSQETVPAFAQQSQQKFDLIYIDGGHLYEEILADLENCRAFAHKDTVLLIDDCYSPTILKAIMTLVNQGHLAIVETFESFELINSGRHERTWIEARYLF